MNSLLIIISNLYCQAVDCLQLVTTISNAVFRIISSSLQSSESKGFREKKKKKAGPGTKLMSVEAIIAHSD